MWIRWSAVASMVNNNRRNDIILVRVSVEPESILRIHETEIHTDGLPGHCNANKMSHWHHFLLPVLHLQSTSNCWDKSVVSFFICPRPRVSDVLSQTHTHRPRHTLLFISDSRNIQTFTFRENWITANLIINWKRTNLGTSGSVVCWGNCRCASQRTVKKRAFTPNPLGDNKHLVHQSALGQKCH